MPSPKSVGTLLHHLGAAPGILTLPSGCTHARTAPRPKIPVGSVDPQKEPACPRLPSAERRSARRAGDRRAPCLRGRWGAQAPARRLLPKPRGGEGAALPAAGPSAGPAGAGARPVFTNMGGAGRGQGAGGRGGSGRFRFAGGCGTALGSGGMARGLLPLLPVVVLIIETQFKNDTEALIHRPYNKLITSRIIAKRGIKCNLDEYNLGVQCCKKCERGFVKNTSCPTDVSKHCVPCKNGKEYTDHVNDLDKCLRCYSCDSVFGLEVAKNCTPAQNTECTCAKDYFCNSSVPCRHCDPCTVCKSGVIEKQCTSTSDTVCGMKDRRKQKGRTSKENLGEVVPKAEASYENVPLIYTGKRQVLSQNSVEGKKI
uniref:TNFR-Cys domain-containing protein n=1 Tax=Accipiter nisus TaxID=211598 RepID=A0A8B9NFP6_9AVES